MKPVRLEVNGRPLDANIEPRQHLGDFLREELLLTGTHLGCEHGVCGACTVLVDGAPARSCIAFPVALDGAKITTIEGLADDPVMARLREAFSAEHGLQCGFCTPGMLIMARDIVLRRPGAEPDEIRHELAGNLCRCTGYVGIVRAIRAVGQERAGLAPVVTRGAAVAPAAAGTPVVDGARTGVTPASPPVAPLEAPQVEPAPTGETGDLTGAVELVEIFRVPASRPEVWAFFQDPAKVVACLPGARLTAPSDGRHIAAEMAVKLGPIQAAFGGAGTLIADPATWSGRIDGQGVDRRSASRVRARLNYVLETIDETSQTQVRVDVAYALTGPLAQMSRGALARDLAGRMTAAFAANLAAALKGDPVPAAPAPLDAGSLVFAMISDWFGRVFRRR
ncbi:2Fe-2S iron-sulfur cluster-binding protein [Ancylobacter terrae]|uniref:2Fe-2S iron-sulfur cluster-binding protein n=1 Tax=Ancylobacter sp. sgz301288 TaxID=3342077 RepID=UPI00385E5421